MGSVFVEDWQALWRVAQRAAAQIPGETPGGVFEPIGLILSNPHEPHRVSPSHGRRPFTLG